MSSKTKACCSITDHLDSRLFKALCDPNRIAILARLANICGPSTVGDIAACCPVDLSVVSRHLAVLREAGIVAATKKGREVFYAVRFADLAATLRGMADAIEACCPTNEPCTGDPK